MILNCIIIDDEPNAVKLLEILIQKNTQWLIKAKCYNALEAMAFLKTNVVDFIFLDINMPRLSGMELAAILPAQTNIVFTTAYSEYAVESYTFHTIDYLLKPITDERFITSIQKIELYFSSQHPVDAPPLSEKEEYFFVKSGRALSQIRMVDILYFEGEREYVRLVTASKQLLVYRRLKDIEEQLSLPFVRVHNSYIINTRQIEMFQDNQIHIGTKQIPLGEKFKDGFMDFLKQRIF